MPIHLITEEPRLGEGERMSAAKKPGLPPGPIKPFDLAVACCLYEEMTPYARSLERFRFATGPALNLGREVHRLVLLQFLNDWGCRNLATEWHEMALDALDSWYSGAHGQLRRVGDSVRIDGGDVDGLAGVFDSLSKRIAAKKTRKGQKLLVSFGPTATSKSLFALRPHALPAWDGPMRKAFGYDDGGDSYVQFAKDVHGKIAETGQWCRERGFDLYDLPAKLGRPAYTTVAQLIIEYYWITGTRGVSLPQRDVVSEWLSWGDQG
jgi:hypothetical protein